MRYLCLMVKSDSEDELRIEKHARKAAEDVLKFILMKETAP